MEEEENRHPPVREDPARGGEKPAAEPSLDADWDQSGAFCAGQVIILKALQQAMGSGLAPERQDPASEKDAECKQTNRRKWCRSSRSEGLGGSWLGTGDPALVCDRNPPMGEVFEAPCSAAVPALAGVLDYLEWACHLPQEVESSFGTQAVYGEEGLEEVELVAEVRLGDVGALSGVLRRDRSWRMQKSVCLGPSAPCWRGRRDCPVGHSSLLEQPRPLNPHRTLSVVDKGFWTSALARSENSLSQDFPAQTKGKTIRTQAEPAARDYESESVVVPLSPLRVRGEPLPADSTLAGDLPPEQMEAKVPGATGRVFVVDGSQGAWMLKQSPQLGKVSLEVATAGNAKLRTGEKASRGPRSWVSSRLEPGPRRNAGWKWEVGTQGIEEGVVE
uniref:Uncharacterized protein n=1 Tax=Sphaerodactylus townsendi TaxID=933632 RepID=A0ACB8EUN4_9SAUR